MNRRLGLACGSLCAALCLAGSGQANARAFNDIFLFGDSYTDTGAYVPLTNGTTAAAYLALLEGITLTTPQNAHPGTAGVNFAESGARISVGPTPPAVHPLSLTQQVGEFQNYVTQGSLTFNPSSTLFFLLGGLNDHAQLTAAQIQAATTAQVSTLYALGGRYFEIADIPSLVPAFADSAANVNPAIIALIPQLKTMFPDAIINLSNWGKDFDDIVANPSKYGITNTTDPCRDLFNTATPTCTNPNQYFLLLQRPSVGCRASDRRGGIVRGGPGDPRAGIHRVDGDRRAGMGVDAPASALAIEARGRHRT